MIQKLKDQLKETHEELDQSKQELQSKEEQVQAVRQEVSGVWVSADLYTFFYIIHAEAFNWENKPKSNIHIHVHQLYKS